MIDRRGFAILAALSTPGLRARPVAAQQELPEGSARADLDPPIHDMSVWPDDWTGDEQVVMLAYPGMTALDLVGPQYMFASLMGAAVRVAAKTLDPARTDTGLVIVPDVTLAEAHEAPTVLFAPRGISGTLNAMVDAETVDFLASRGETAAPVTSVCTGALLPGQAGLLDGYRAITHWLAMPALDAFGAEAVGARVVRDRSRLTGGGVTAGLVRPTGNEGQCARHAAALGCPPLVISGLVKGCTLLASSSLARLPAPWRLGRQRRVGPGPRARRQPSLRRLQDEGAGVPP